MAGVLRIKRKGCPEMTFVRYVAKRDVEEACREHLQMFRGEMVPTNNTAKSGRRLYDRREIPTDVWEFEWVEGIGTPQETVELITLR